jgi:hypothetical protein
LQFPLGIVLIHVLVVKFLLLSAYPFSSSFGPL